MVIANHECEKLAEVLQDSKIDDFSIVNIVIRKIEDHDWLLTKYYYADEQTVYDGEATCVGEVVSEFSMSIYFCPFCGKELI